jgi:hypothetical protein
MNPRKTKPRPYGRQGKDKTIKSLSLDQDVALWVKKEAQERGVSESSLVNELLKKLLILAILSTLARLILGADPVTAALGGLTDAGTVAYYIGTAAVYAVGFAVEVLV